MSLKIFFFSAALRFSAQRYPGLICVLIPFKLSQSPPPTLWALTEELRQRPHMVLRNSPKACLAALVV